MNNINFGKIFDPRPHQKEALQAFDNGMNKIILLWSRRAGKSLFAWTTVLMSLRPLSEISGLL